MNLDTTPLFIAQRKYIVIEVTERHEIAGTDGGTVTVMLNKVPSGTAPASGTSVLSAGFDLKATINTNQTGTLSSIKADVALSKGDALALETTGTMTDVEGVTISIILKSV